MSDKVASFKPGHNAGVRKRPQPRRRCPNPDGIIRFLDQSQPPPQQDFKLAHHSYQTQDGNFVSENNDQYNQPEDNSGMFDNNFDDHGAYDDSGDPVPHHYPRKKIPAVEPPPLPFPNAPFMKSEPRFHSVAGVHGEKHPVSESPSELRDSAPSRILADFIPNMERMHGTPNYRTGICRSVSPGRTVVHSPEYFERNMLRPASMMEVDVPDASKTLMTPLERRQILDVEKRAEEARKVAKKELNDKQRFVDLVQKQYPHGILGLESPETRGTLIYADNQKARAREMSREQFFTDSRRQFIQTNVERPVTEAEANYLFQSKKRTHRPLDTIKFETLPPLPTKDRGPRCVELRNKWTNGKNYDIITGQPYQHYPPDWNEKVNMRQAHPSIHINPHSTVVVNGGVRR